MIVFDLFLTVIFVSIIGFSVNLIFDREVEEK